MFIPIQNAFSLLFSYVIFLGSGIFLLFLIQPNYIIKKTKKNAFLELFIVINAISFSYYAFIGYLLDIFWEISCCSNLFLILILIGLFLFIRYKKIQELYLTIKEKVFLNKEQKFSSFFNKNFLNYVIFILILMIFVYRIFTYAIKIQAIPQTDPLVTYNVVINSINFKHITWGDLQGILNWNDRTYPLGFYFNLIFLSIYDVENIYFYLKFLGPILSVLNLLLIYLVIKKITKNVPASLIGMLIWTSLFINSFFSTITVASVMGIFMALTSLLVLFDEDDGHPMLSGIIAGGGILIHIFSGGVFIVSAIIFYLILKKAIGGKNRFYDLFWYLVMISIVILPYVILFRSQTFNLASLVDLPNIFLNIAPNIRNQIILRIFNSQINFNIDSTFLNNTNMEFEIFGPHSYFLIFSPLFLFGLKKYRKYFSFIIMMLVLTLFYIYNPIIINGEFLRTKLDSIYLWQRVIWFFSIPYILLICIGFASMQEFISEKIISRKIEKKKLKFFLKNVIEIILIFLMVNESYMFIRNPEYVYGFKNDIPNDYNQTILWLNFEIEKNSEIIVSEENWGLTPYYIDLFYEGIGNNLMFEKNNSYYPYYLENTSFTYEIPSLFWDYDYIVLDINNTIYYENLIQNNQIGEIYHSESCRYLVFQIY